MAQPVPGLRASSEHLVLDCQVKIYAHDNAGQFHSGNGETPSGSTRLSVEVDFGRSTVIVNGSGILKYVDGMPDSRTLGFTDHVTISENEIEWFVTKNDDGNTILDWVIKRTTGEYFLKVFYVLTTPNEDIASKRPVTAALSKKAVISELFGKCTTNLLGS